MFSVISPYIVPVLTCSLCWVGGMKLGFHMGTTKVAELEELLKASINNKPKCTLRNNVFWQVSFMAPGEDNTYNVAASTYHTDSVAAETYVLAQNDSDTKMLVSTTSSLYESLKEQFGLDNEFSEYMTHVLVYKENPEDESWLVDLDILINIEKTRFKNAES